MKRFSKILSQSNYLVFRIDKIMRVKLVSNLFFIRHKSKIRSIDRIRSLILFATRFAKTKQSGIIKDTLNRSEVLHEVKEHRKLLYTLRRRKANWIGGVVLRNCFLKHVIDGKIEGRIEETGRLGRRRKQILDDLKEMRGYCKLKVEALDCIVWRTRFRRPFGPDIIQTME